MTSIFRPNKPGDFDGRRERFFVDAWLYQVSQYHRLVQVASLELDLSDATKIGFASMLLKGTAASWWYVLVQSQQIPVIWQDLEAAVRAEVVPQERIRRARDKLRKLSQRTSVSSYLTELRNTVLAILGISDDEKLDRFCSGLKPQVKLEVLKSNPATVDDAARISLSVDSALFGAGMYSSCGGKLPGFGISGPQPIEIGNLEKKGTHYRGRSFRGNKGKAGMSTGDYQQRMKDMLSGSCFFVTRKTVELGRTRTLEQTKRLRQYHGTIHKLKIRRSNRKSNRAIENEM